MFVPLVAPLGVGLINNLKAKILKRRGASLLQPYRNLWKLFHKDEVISRDASFIFRSAPFIAMGVTIIVGACLPIFTSTLNTPMSDLLAIVYTLALGTFFMALAAMDSGSAFGGFGSSREMTISAIVEASFISSILTVALLSGTTNIAAMSAGLSPGRGNFLIPIVLAFTGFCIVLLAETSRYPFDNPATHLELTMIHESMLLEFSGKRLALMEWAAANRLLIFSILAVNLFFPIGIDHDQAVLSVLLGISSTLLKVSVVYIVLAILESTIAKYRFFRLPDLLLVAFVLNVVAIGLVL